MRIGIDIGGTFTDFVLFNPDTQELHAFKVLSTPNDPAEAVLHGIHVLNQQFKIERLQIIHGSTVATNALLERKGARTAFITTLGFGDLLQIGRQNRPSLYDLAVDPPEPLVPQIWRYEIAERVDHHGNVLRAPVQADIDALIPEMTFTGVESVAICLLFSFLHPHHELLIAQKLRAAGFFVSPSCEILPEFREYERASTTVINAYVTPILNRYLTNLENRLTSPINQVNLQVMQSNGGTISFEEARQAGVRCILSGPAGGVIGARFVAELATLHPTGPDREKGKANQPALKVITFDMGGTSTDVSLIDGVPHMTTETEIVGFPLRIPVLDIHTIGAGGGSIARVDQGGALRVGPESAGADPGPACYGRAPDTDSSGLLATVTDAHLVLGRLAPEYFLGGDMPLNTNLAAKALTHLGTSLGLDPFETALGVVEVTDAHMERALRVISVERGYDPKDFTLVSFGGAGGLHAVELARRLGIPQVLIPPMAATLSAFGMLTADVTKDYTQTVMLPGDTRVEAIEQLLTPLVEKGFREVMNQGISKEDIIAVRQVDLRYQGQSYELSVPFSEHFLEAFHQAHKMAYGYERPEASLEIVNVRARVTGIVKAPRLRKYPPSDQNPTPALLEYRLVVTHDGRDSHQSFTEVPFYKGEALKPGNTLGGPAIVVRSDTTVMIGPNDLAKVDGYHNLIVKIGT